MNYSQAMEFLEGTKKYGSRLGLAGIRNLMDELGNVQDRVPVVHIAGTNGKGSVGAMLSAVMVSAGYKAGRFSTPDVFSYEEEFMMNGIPIAKERLAELFTQVAKACEKLVREGKPHPTRFEVETAAAFLWFFEEACDIALVEVGMGGETDATNLVEKPLVSVLTPISMDHMKFLGNSIREIAQVKAGIIKKGCPVVSACQKPEAMEVIAARCGQMNAALVQADASGVRDIEVTDGIYRFSYWMQGNENNGKELWKDIQPGLKGRFQIENTVCVMETLRVLSKQYKRISEHNIREGIAKVRWPGRFEQIGSGPDFYLDGAHNEDAVQKLRKTADECFEGRKVIYIMGVLADKEYDRMIEIMFRPEERVFTVTPQNPRALDAGTLTKQLSRKNIRASYCENAKDAVLYALQEAQDEDVILAFGSLYYLREIREAYKDIMK